MREERGNVKGPITVDEPYTLWGSIFGDVRVVDGGKMYVRGNIHGDLIVDFGGRVHVFGRVTGSLLMFEGTKVINSGTIDGNATNEGGRLYVDSHGTVLGKIKTEKNGKTVVEDKLDTPEEYQA
jgi:cytoskeletal protein CcmA (bactofilin family)